CRDLDLQPSSAKYLRCCAMINGRYGRPSEAVAMLTWRFSGVDCALAATGNVASRTRVRIERATLVVGCMGVPPGSTSAALVHAYCRHNTEDCQAPIGSELFRTGIDDRPEVGAVEDALHVGRQPALFVD